MLYRLRPYEAVHGAVDAMHEKWKKVCNRLLYLPDIRPGANSRNCAGRLSKTLTTTLKLLDIKKPRVGVVGEILVKFLPAANNYLVELLESEGAEAVVPDLLDFLLYCFYNQNFKVSQLGIEEIQSHLLGNLGIKALEWFRCSGHQGIQSK